jgi:thioredoxin-like negative regulator of GroEL
MELTFNTSIVDVSVALSALNYYRSGNFREAINALIQILDQEPRNWDARLMLAACYYKTGQYAAAGRGFRYLYEQAEMEDVRKRAHQGLLSTNSKIGVGTATQMEFAGVRIKNSNAAWLD